MRLRTPTEVLLDLEPRILGREFAACRDVLASHFASWPESPYHVVIGHSFSNHPKDLALTIDHFVQWTSEIIAVRTVMAEYNADLFSFSLFAYAKPSTQLDEANLSRSDLRNEDPIPLTGFDAIQSLYAQPISGNQPQQLTMQTMKEFANAYIVLSFFELLSRSLRHVSFIHVEYLLAEQEGDPIRCGADTEQVARANAR